MANHRRNRTTRREVKRLDTKAFRAAEQRAMDHSVRNPRTDMWGRGPDLPIPDDAPSNGKRHSKRTRPKKSRCPINRKHEWARKWVENVETYHDMIRDCPICEVQSKKWIERKERWAERYGDSFDPRWNPYNPRWCDRHGPLKSYTTRAKIATCIHCGESKRESYESDRWGSWRTSRKRTLPKRTVKLY